VKVMLTVLFDSEGVIHYEFLYRGQTVNKECFPKVMKGEKKQGEKSWKRSGAFLLIRDFLRKREMKLISQPLHSPDLALLFTHLKCMLKGWWFESAKEVKKICWKSYTKFQKRHSKNASKTGRNPRSDV
jgi:hypothetical protein